MNKLYGPGYDDSPEDTLPKWAAKAIAKNQSIPTVDNNGQRIPLSAFGGSDDRDIVEHEGRYYIKVASGVAYFARLAKEKGYSF